MVFQSYHLFGHMSVMDNLLLGPLKVQKRERAEAQAQAEALLARVGLLDKRDAYPRQLSGGQQQRIAIVRSLCMNPQVMLFDEVTAALDPEMVKEVLQVIQGLARDGMTLLIVTHEMAFARAVADRIVFMEAGRILEQSDPESFFSQPRTARAQQFLDKFSFVESLPKTMKRNCHENCPAYQTAGALVRPGPAGRLQQGRGTAQASCRIAGHQLPGNHQGPRQAHRWRIHRQAAVRFRRRKRPLRRLRHRHRPAPGQDLLGDENKVEFVAVEPASRIPFLQSDKVDLILANMTVTPERKEAVDFTNPNLRVAVQAIVADGSPVQKLDDLADRTIIVTTGTTADIWLTKNHPDWKLLKFEKNSESLQALANGRGDAYAQDNLILFSWAKQNPGYRVLPQLLGEEAPIAPAVKKGNTELRDWVNAELAKLGRRSFC